MPNIYTRRRLVELGSTWGKITPKVTPGGALTYHEHDGDGNSSGNNTRDGTLPSAAELRLSSERHLRFGCCKMPLPELAVHKLKHGLVVEVKEFHAPAINTSAGRRKHGAHKIVRRKHPRLQQTGTKVVAAGNAHLAKHSRASRRNAIDERLVRTLQAAFRIRVRPVTIYVDCDTMPGSQSQSQS